jgi:hypothetical protein
MKEYICRNKDTGVEFILTEEQYKEMEHMFEIIKEKDRKLSRGIVGYERYITREERK